MLGIALEGGGAKGAFHIGVLQACMETGYYPPQVIAGTSIGAFNAAMVAQGDFEMLKRLWESIRSGDVFPEDAAKFLEIDPKALEWADIPDLLSLLRRLIEDGGVDIGGIRSLIDRWVNPKKLMASPIDFGLVSFTIPDFKPVELFKEQMGEENISFYIMASAALPGFQPVRKGEKIFLDGGLYDNCPVDLLLSRGCEQVIAVRTHAIGATRYDPNDPRVITISPSDELGPLLRLSPEISRKNITMGYLDGLRVLKGLYGKKYYITELDLPNVSRLLSLPEDAIQQIGDLLHMSARAGEYNQQRFLLERIIPVLFDGYRLERSQGYDEFFLALAESRAERCQIDRLRLYKASQLVNEALSAEDHCDKQTNINLAGDIILRHLLE